MKNSILWDCHMHSSFSADSDTDMENMIKGAISRGLEGVCFTEHLDPDYPPTPDQQIFHLDLDAYARRLSFLREKYKDSIMINFGIEYGLQPHLKENLKNHLKLYQKEKMMTLLLLQPFTNPKDCSIRMYFCGVLLKMTLETKAVLS